MKQEMQESSIPTLIRRRPSRVAWTMESVRRATDFHLPSTYRDRVGSTLRELGYHYQSPNSLARPTSSLDWHGVAELEDDTFATISTAR